MVPMPLRGDIRVRAALVGNHPERCLDGLHTPEVLLEPRIPLMVRWYIVLLLLLVVLLLLLCGGMEGRHGWWL